MPNTNIDTGIRFGVVHLHSLAEWVYDEFFHNGTNLTYEWALEEFLSTLDEDADQDAAIDEWHDSGGSECDEECYELHDTEEGLKLGLSYLGGAPLVWVYESPYTTFTGLCSPCVPNAGDLDHSSKPKGSHECYELPASWY